MQFMPNNKQGSGQSNQDMGRQSQGAQGGYGNTSHEAGGSRQDNEMDRGRQSSGRRTGERGGNDDEM
jgi:hypothetical protein